MTNEPASAIRLFVIRHFHAAVGLSLFTDEQGPCRDFDRLNPAAHEVREEPNDVIAY